MIFWDITSRGSTRWPRKKSLRKIKEALRSKTPRSNGHSLEAIIEDVNQHPSRLV